MRINPRIKGRIRNSLSDQPITSIRETHSTILQNLSIRTSASEGVQKVEPTHQAAGLYPLTLWVILRLSLCGHSHSCKCSQSSVPQTSLSHASPSVMTTTKQNAKLPILKPHEEKESHCTRLQPKQIWGQNTDVKPQLNRLLKELIPFLNTEKCV